MTTIALPVLRTGELKTDNMTFFDFCQEISLIPVASVFPLKTYDRKLSNLPQVVCQHCFIFTTAGGQFDSLQGLLKYCNRGAI